MYTITTAISALEDFMEYVESEIDLSDEHSIVESGTALRELATTDGLSQSTSIASWAPGRIFRRETVLPLRSCCSAREKVFSFALTSGSLRTQP